MPNLSPQHFGDFWSGSRIGGFQPSVPAELVGITREQWDEGAVFLAHPDRYLEMPSRSENGTASWFWYLLLHTPNGGQVVLDECLADGVFRVTAERPDGAKHQKESAYILPFGELTRKSDMSKYEEHREKEDAETVIALRRQEKFLKAVEYAKQVARSMG